MYNPKKWYKSVHRKKKELCVLTLTTSVLIYTYGYMFKYTPLSSICRDSIFWCLMCLFYITESGLYINILQVKSSQLEKHWLSPWRSLTMQRHLETQLLPICSSLPADSSKAESANNEGWISMQYSFSGLFPSQCTFIVGRGKERRKGTSAEKS